MKSSDAAKEAYRNGLCVDCRKRRYSAGRPRCNECHAARQPRIMPGVNIPNK